MWKSSLSEVFVNPVWNTLPWAALKDRKPTVELDISLTSIPVTKQLGLLQTLVNQLCCWSTKFVAHPRKNMKSYQKVIKSHDMITDQIWYLQ